MGLENAYSGKLLYHLTELNNLPSIIDLGLVPRKILREHTVRFEDVANPEIIVKREQKGLSDYVPFHFHPYTAFDLAVKKGHPNQEMIYICIKRELARKNNFKILPKHPLAMESYQLYDYEEGFEKINWGVLTQVGAKAEDAKQIKMAECLSHLVIPVEYFQCIYVASPDVKKHVECILMEKGVEFPPPYVNSMPQWFC